MNRRRRAAVTRMEAQRQHRQKKSRKPAAKLQKNPTVPYFRLILVWGILIAGGLALVGNLYHLQIVHAPQLTEIAQRQQRINYAPPSISRRSVVDRNNNVLAFDRVNYTFYAHPRYFVSDQEKKEDPNKLEQKKLEVATQLSTILNRPVAEIVELFNRRASGILIASSVSEEVADKIRDLNVSGLDLLEQHLRLYPQESLAASVVGYVDLDSRSQAGIEYSQRNLLERSAPAIPPKQKAQGKLTGDRISSKLAQQDYLKLQLTLDTRMQRAARLALKEQMEKFNALRGGVIVMDAQDGSILALVAEPSYNPNEYYKANNVQAFKNWVLADLYEPGSTFKPINVAIALEERAIQPNDVFPDPDVIKVSGWSIRNAEKEDNTSLSVTGILQHSSNVGMVQMMQRLKPATYYSWLQKIGLGKPVGIDLPFEARGQLKSQKQFVSSPIEPATTSFGQGFSLTPIQLVQLHAALANGGKLVTPHVVRGLVDDQGQLQEQAKVPQPRAIFSPQTAQTVLKMMETVVTQGTGKASQIQGYRIAGKTGTAQKASPTGGYQSNAKITSFVGMMPVDAPRYVVLAVVDEPKKGIAFGSTVAAPIVKSVMESIISLERITPTQPIPQASPSPQ